MSCNVTFAYNSVGTACDNNRITESAKSREKSVCIAKLPQSYQDEPYGCE